MTLPLVTDEMMASLRGYAYPGLQSEVIILRREVIVDGPYGDGTEEWVEYETVPGWLHGRNDPSLGAQDQVIVSIGIYRLMVPVGTDIRIADLVAIGGDQFTVQDTTAENTYQVFLEVTVKKVS